MTDSIRAALWILLVGLPVRLVGQEAAVLRPIDGVEIKGAFLGVLPDGKVQIRRNELTESIDPSRLVAIEFQEGTNTLAPWTMRFDLATGDILMGQIERGNADEITVATALGGTVKLLLDHLSRFTVAEQMKSGLVLPEPSGKDEDELFLSGAGRVDRLPGELLKVDRSALLFKSDGGGERSFSFAQDKIIAVRLARTDATKPREALGLVARVRGRDGSRISGVLGGTKDGAPTLEIATGQVLQLDRRALSVIEFQHSSFRFLSDLPIVDLRQIPYFEGGPVRPVSRDRAFGKDAPLRIGSTSFRRGLACNAMTSMSFDLAGRFAILTAAVGVDPSTRDRPVPGSARVRILADGKEIHFTPVLRAGDEPRPIDLKDLERVQRLTIVVEFADSGPTGATVILGDAFVRAAG